MKKCIICLQEKIRSEFYGRAAKCKACAVKVAKEWKKNNREKALEHQRRSNKNRRLKRRVECSLRRKRFRRAKPDWVDMNELKYIYSLASERGLVVDHIIPLKNPIVCGLHVPENLRCIPRDLNAMKLNRFNQKFASEHAALAATLAKWK